MSTRHDDLTDTPYVLRHLRERAHHEASTGPQKDIAIRTCARAVELTRVSLTARQTTSYFFIVFMPFSLVDKQSPMSEKRSAAECPGAHYSAPHQISGPSKASRSDNSNVNGAKKPSTDAGPPPAPEIPAHWFLGQPPAWEDGLLAIQGLLRDPTTLEQQQQQQHEEEDKQQQQQQQHSQRRVGQHSPPDGLPPWAHPVDINPSAAGTPGRQHRHHHQEGLGAAPPAFSPAAPRGRADMPELGGEGKEGLLPFADFGAGLSLDGSGDASNPQAAPQVENKIKGLRRNSTMSFWDLWCCARVCVWK